ncbi:MAG: FG-GAP-like repeat-containing protein [bacterium]|nr:FG-GAP-like repeat-containing protein [bacterium]
MKANKIGALMSGRTSPAARVGSCFSCLLFALLAYVTTFQIFPSPLYAESEAGVSCRSASSQPDSGVRSSSDDESEVGKEVEQLLWRDIEVIFVAPSEFVDGRRESDVVRQVESLVSSANLYLAELHLRLKIKRIQLFRDKAHDPYFESASRGDAYGMLEAGRQRWRNEDIEDRDLVVVLGKGRFHETLGLSYIRSSCFSVDWSVIFVAQGGDSDFYRASFVTTFVHELGHYLGMSHDKNFYSDGPSMMWPFYAPNAVGYSVQSIREYLNYMEEDGSRCFAFADDDLTSSADKLVAMTDQSDVKDNSLLVFSLTEGVTFVDFLRRPGDEKGTLYLSDDLPDGAWLNATTAEFRYKPSFDTVFDGKESKELTFHLRLKSFNKTAQRTVTLLVHNLNRAPQLLEPVLAVGHETYSFRGQAGRQITQVIRFVDPDGDDLRFAASVPGKLASFPGNAFLAWNDGMYFLKWDVPAGLSGQFEFPVAVVDGEGSRAQLLVQVLVGSEAVGELKVENTDKGAEVTSLASSAGADSQGSFVWDLEHMPKGVLAEFVNVNSIKLSLLPEAFAAADRFTDLSSFAVGRQAQSGLVLEQSLLSFDSGAQVSSWPGSSCQTGVIGGDLSYRASDGVWYYSKGGKPLKQFGGLYGDLPVFYLERGKQRPAIYRRHAGQGYWVIDSSNGTKIVPWGLASDVPLAADFDGDAISDLAVFRPENMSWHINFSSGMASQELHDNISVASNSLRHMPFVGDFDGDGFADRALYLWSKKSTEGVHLWLASGRHLFLSFGRSNSFTDAGVGFVVPELPFVRDSDKDGRDDICFLVNNSVSCFSTLAGKIRSFGRVEKHELAQAEFFSSHRALSLGLGARGDVDHDGKSDIAVWRGDSFLDTGEFLTRVNSGLRRSGELGVGYGYPFVGRFSLSAEQTNVLFANGLWHLSGDQRILQWGEAGDFPVPGDYNGDGLDDLVVYRPGDGSWWISFSGEQTSAITFSLGEGGRDVPLAADFNGDGAVEPIIWRPEIGLWIVRYLDGTTDTFTFGRSGDVPLAGDYTGDGRAEAAIWRPSTGEWIISTGDERVIVRQWGLSGDVPVPFDYNGDGSLDLVVWRPQSGMWYIRELSYTEDKVSLVQFGLPGDVPVYFKRYLRIF